MVPADPAICDELFGRGARQVYIDEAVAVNMAELPSGFLDAKLHTTEAVKAENYARMLCHFVFQNLDYGYVVAVKQDRPNGEKAIEQDGKRGNASEESQAVDDEIKCLH